MMRSCASPNPRRELTRARLLRYTHVHADVPVHEMHEPRRTVLYVNAVLMQRTGALDSTSCTDAVYDYVFYMFERRRAPDPDRRATDGTSDANAKRPSASTPLPTQSKRRVRLEVAARHTMVQHHTLHACSTILAPPGSEPLPLLHHSSHALQPANGTYPLCVQIVKREWPSLGVPLGASAASLSRTPAVPLTSRITGAPYGGEADVLASATLSYREQAPAPLRTRLSGRRQLAMAAPTRSRAGAWTSARRLCERAPCARPVCHPTQAACAWGAWAGHGANPASARCRPRSCRRRRCRWRCCSCSRPACWRPWAWAWGARETRIAKGRSARAEGSCLARVALPPWRVEDGLPPLISTDAIARLSASVASASAALRACAAARVWRTVACQRSCACGCAFSTVSVLQIALWKDERGLGTGASGAPPLSSAPETASAQGGGRPVTMRSRTCDSSTCPSSSSARHHLQLRATGSSSPVASTCRKSGDVVDQSNVRRGLAADESEAVTR